MHARRKALSELNVYLVATDEPAYASRNLAGPILDYLECHGVVAGPCPLEPAWLAPGPRAWSLFDVPARSGAAFEYAIIYSSSRAQLVPNAHTGSFGSRCVCGRCLDASLHELLEEQGSQDDHTDARTLRVSCQCGRVMRPQDIAADVSLAVTCFYINLCAVDSANIRHEHLQALGNVAGVPLRVLVESL